MTALKNLLATFRKAAVSEREKGTYFEELCIQYLRNEATYRDLYSDVWMYGDWTKAHPEFGLNAKDTGIDLVAKTNGTNEFHAIQCKFYGEDHRVTKADIDSFFTASGKKAFSRRVIVTTTNNWSDNAEVALFDQYPPVTKIDLNDLENSQIEWSKFQPGEAEIVFKKKKTLREHQKTALDAVKAGLQDTTRGKLIMACGTGKTFTALKIAESIAGSGKRVLFLVPSLSLLSQTLTEWTQESETPLHSFAVCSDSDIGKKKHESDNDEVRTFAHELRYPATTDAKSLAREMHARHDANHMSVVFSTYHSIQVISDAQHEYDLADFDLIICDEAHRTTGVTFGGDDESAFVKVHDAQFLRAAKRLYMTATPRIYSDAAEAKAEKEDAKLYGMNNEEWYGKELYVITFSEAVKRGLLCDYKVIVLAVEESHVNRRLQSLWKDENNTLKVDDAAKIIGCWKALAKIGTQEELSGDIEPMRKAVAFCQVIETQKAGGKTHKVSSKQIAGMFQRVVETYQESEDIENSARLICEAEHVDGSMNASEKEEKLNWLKAETPENTCRILSNVRCLSEGVDVPALDAVLFLTPRSSQVDVVQSVGRVMRTVKDKDGNDIKKRGYVILPVVIPAGVEPEKALDDNKTYRVVWQVLQALRSHDDRFDAMINKLELAGSDKSKMEVIAITDKIQKKQDKNTNKKKGDTGKGSFVLGEASKKFSKEDQAELQFEVGEIERALYAKVVKKCGNRSHWEDWANDIAKIARTHIDRITGILEDASHEKERKSFYEFAAELRDDLNDSITDTEIVEMLAQHLITKPVFDALFEGYSFAQHNPMSQAMQGVLDVLQEHNLDKEADTLEKFYASVKLRAEGITNAEGKQKIVVELYDKFFRNAFPKMTERLGIVYTPVEVVDFIIHSVNHILQTEFGQTLGSKGVHIIDPFTGTGTFITRLLQSGLIKTEEMAHKYKHEIHANEIVLLAYYIAAINIEAVYHSIVGGEYQPFEGICLTDTFQLYEKDDLVDQLLEKNSARRKRQKKLDIRVIMGNPPYSAGQSSGNDNNANIEYKHLDKRIRESYAERSAATLKNALYDSYIRAIRWASDRIGNAGVIGFVTNAGFLEANTADGLRKCLAEEFSSIYVFHLRGNQRTQGELSRKEGGKIFGSGSRAPIAISMLVKNPDAKQHGQIYWHDIGDYLNREEKLETISSFTSIGGITEAKGWQAITPDQHGDWLKQRDDSFNEFIVIGDKKDKSRTGLFVNYSNGVKTNRDAWCYNFSENHVSGNIRRMIEFYNAEVRRYKSSCEDLSKDKFLDPEDFVTKDVTKISWTREVYADVGKGHARAFEPTGITHGLYRPFTKQWIYFNKHFNNCVYQMPRIFPDAATKNLVICVSGMGFKDGVSALISNAVPDLQIQFNGQCFPLYLYESAEDSAEIDFDGTGDMFASKADKPAAGKGDYTRKDAITDSGLKHFSDAYPGEKISKEDLFYYVYGLLHSPDYRERYADNLSKELPRIPAVKTAKDFWHFSKAGRNLAELHLNYETVKPYSVKMEVAGKTALTDEDYRVEKMKYGKNGKDKDLTTLIYNDRITLRGIPLEAYDYVVNGKPALDWVLERQCVKTDKDSGIVNDANDWAIDTMGDAKYPLELFMRVVTVSLETMKIVNGLPKLDI
jgi:predicted helicase